jgi:hypothetical protein
VSRRRPSYGTIEFFSKYLDAFNAHLLHDVPADKKEAIFTEARKIHAINGAFSTLRHLGQISETTPEQILPEDKTINMAIESGWHTLALESFVDSFGRYGTGAISSIAEAVFYANAFAVYFGSHSLFYRGEQHYGYELKSRAERYMPTGAGDNPGLTDQEITELRRFQYEVNADPSLIEAEGENGKTPSINSPLWLPIMQHYDEKFGTRLLDISSSVFTGLYFACVGWNGQIDTKLDGLLYSFMQGNGGLTMRGFYFDEKPEDFDEEMDNIAPSSIEESFKNWVHPEIMRLYKSSSTSSREIAQDGYFLVKGSLKEGYGFGQGFKYRIPANVKHKIAKELWLAGYTPERMIRGPKGRVAHKALSKELGL